MLTVSFGEYVMSRTQALLWYKRFKKDWEDANDSARSGRPRMPTNDENIEAVKKMFFFIIIVKIVYGIKRVVVKIVPKLQNFAGAVEGSQGRSGYA